MAFTRETDDLQIISKLDDQPNVDDEHDGAWLKAKFDEAGGLLKVYINNTLLAELEGTGAAGNIGVASIVGLTADNNVQAMLEAIYQIAKDAQAGVVADGSIYPRHLNETFVLPANMVDPNYVAGADNIGTGAVITPKLEDGAVTRPKIADGAVSSTFQATILSTYDVHTDAWTEEEGEYKQTVDVEGLVSGTAVTAAAADDLDPDVSAAVTAALANITFTAGADTLDAVSTEEVTIDLPLKVTQSGTDYDVTIPVENVTKESYWNYDGPPYMQEVEVPGLVPEDPDDATTTITWTLNSSDPDVIAAYDLIEKAADTDAAVASTDSVIEVDVPVIATQNGTPHLFTILAGGWIATGLPMKQVVAVTGILATDDPIVDVVPSDDYETATQQISDFGSIYRITTADGEITCYADGVTIDDVPVKMKVVRK